MVAWIDSPRGRMWAAGIGAIIVLVGLVTYAAGVVAWSPLKWAGGVVALLGAIRIVLAYAHPTRSGFGELMSEACQSTKHEECSGDVMAESCDCKCHRRLLFAKR